jgi:hypothetical protein
MKKKEKEEIATCFYFISSLQLENKEKENNEIGWRTASCMCVCIHHREIMRRKTLLLRLIILLQRRYCRRLFLLYQCMFACVFPIFFSHCSFTAIVSVMRQFHLCNNTT